MYGCDIGSVMGWGNGMTHLIFMILIVSLAVVFISRIMSQQKKNMDSTDSLSILKRRLVSGEITLEEYEKLKNAI
ncbi:MAG: SHOCT domain-containing protein [Desulfovibrio sp.]|nr:SHOCT domain-containing protein [Desulfovibrio sp.]